MNYRADIDGLRALAVASVLLFHAGIPGVGGGYIGVDVFFVISGFLVTQLLQRGDTQPLGTQLRAFYLRRARRILPALFLVCAVTALLGAWLLLPQDLVRLGHFLRLAPLSLANLVAWQEQDYSNLMVVCQPLLHLWSIAIEEQFYLVYPLLLFGLRRAVPERVPHVLAAVGVLSLAHCCWMAWAHPMANYYSPLSRAWELLLGALVALVPVRWEGDRAEIGALLALAALVASAAAFSATTRAPGPATLLPCVATVVLLVTGQGGGTVVSRVLSKRAWVGVGLISYSLYLWHWPALSYLNYVAIEPPGRALQAAVLSGIAGLSYLTWLLVERPLRRRQRWPDERSFVTGMVVAGSMLVLCGVLFAAHQGWPERFAVPVRALIGPYTERFLDDARCANLPDEAVRRGELCHYGPSQQALRVVVWGDSHALVLLPALQSLATQRQVAIDMAASPSCRPFLADVPPPCRRFNEAMLEALTRLKPDVLLLASYWGQAGGRGRPALDAATLQGHLAALLGRVRAHGRTVCLVLDPPILDYSASYALPMARRWGRDPASLRKSRTQASLEDPMQAPAAALAMQPHVRVIDLKDSLCRGEWCEFQRDGVSLYRDRDHLSVAGAGLVAPALAACLPGAAGTEKDAPP